MTVLKRINNRKVRTKELIAKVVYKNNLKTQNEIAKLYLIYCIFMDLATLSSDFLKAKQKH
jgi:arginine repressor